MKSLDDVNVNAVYVVYIYLHYNPTVDNKGNMTSISNK